MMDSVTEEGIHTIVIMSSAQIGKTELLLNVIGYHVDQDPCSMIAVQPTLTMGEQFSKDRVAPMFRDTPALANTIGDPRAKNSANTLLHKKYPGGSLSICGANSPASLAARAAKLGLGDEIDRWPISTGTEGDGIGLLKKRLSTYHDSRLILTSTPTVKGASRIEMAFEESDQRRYYVPCPHCGGMQSLQWKQVMWAKGDDGHWDGSSPWYECEECSEVIDESDKTRMLRDGRWVAEAYSRGVAGFHINELYSPWRRWGDIVQDFLAAKKDAELMRVWVNTSLGETFEEGGDGIEPAHLYTRREHYTAVIPRGAVVLTSGVDVQDDRIEVEVFGWGVGEERWSIGYRILWGDPADDAVWEALDDVLLRGKFKHESGATLGVSAACIDSGGHHTQRVYEYCRARAGRRIFAIAGRAGFGRAMVSAPSSKRHGRNRRPVELFTLGVDEIKTHIHNKLGVAEPGPGYCHFPISDEYPEEYFKQLGAEVVQTKFVKGVPKRVWKLTRRRNEALDVNVYGYAALILLNPNIDAFAARLSPAEDAPETVETQLSKHQKRIRPQVRRGNFASRWK